MFGFRGNTSVIANPGYITDRQDVNVQYTGAKIIGNGSFGVVYSAKLVETGEPVAIKKVLQDKRYKNRELEFMRRLDHQNIVRLRYFFYSASDQQNLYLNLIMEFIPETLYRVNRTYRKRKQRMPMIWVKIYMHQVFRALGYIHSLGICHRDVKPQNMLVDQGKAVLKLCDFGSAKILSRDQPSVSYICSRYYRAPELIFGATQYTNSVDLWSAGCVLGELLSGTALFAGDSGVDQLVEIIKTLGTPKPDEIRAMNPSYASVTLPQLKQSAWSKVFAGSLASSDALSLISQLLRYVPGQRISPVEACCHSFFNELRLPTTRLPDGKALPPSIDFTERELQIQPGWNQVTTATRFAGPSLSNNVYQPQGSQGLTK